MTFDERWEALDATGKQHVASAAANIGHTDPVATPVGATPAGNYVGVYWQYGTTHPIPAQALMCTAEWERDGLSTPYGKVGGNGIDDVGTFNLIGAYEHAKLLLAKTYVLGTGDPNENLGHTVQLRLRCCELMGALPARAEELQRWGAPMGVIGFYGTWHVRTANYCGDADMCLWLPPTPVVVGHVITQSVTTSVTQVATDVDGDGVADGVTTQQTTTVTQTATPQWGMMLQNPFGPKAPPPEQMAQPVAQTATPMAQPMATPVGQPMASVEA